MIFSAGLNRRVRFVVLGLFVVAASWLIVRGEQKVDASAQGPTTTFTGAPGRDVFSFLHQSLSAYFADQAPPQLLPDST